MHVLLKTLMRILTVGVAVVYVAAVVSAQVSCPFLRCTGPAGDVWMLPFFLSLVGIPATVCSLMFVAEWVWPKSPAVVVLKYVALASAVLPVAVAVVFGLLAGMRGARTH
jgi:hypothetical protein